MRFMILTIPYNPGWIVGKEHIAIIVSVNLTMAKPLPIPRNLTMLTTTPTTNAKVNASDPYGYTYIGSCMGNSVVLNNPPGLPGASSWQLESCYEFSGPIPFFFVGWGSGVWSNGVTAIGIDVTESYAQSGSGFYVTYAIFNYSNNNYVTTVTSAYPTITFSSQTNIILNSFCGKVTAVTVTYGSSLGSACVNTIPTYYVPGSGVLFLGPSGNIAAVTFYDCLYQAGTCEPIYVANGTMILSLSSYSPGTLYIYPYLDVGNGSITNTLSILTNQGLAGEAFLVLDGQYISYNPSTGSSPTYVQACSNAPSPSQVQSNYVEYDVENVITTYKPILPGWAPAVGGVIAEMIADIIGEALESPYTAIAPLIGFGFSYLLTAFTTGSAIYQYYYVNIGTNPSTAWSFYTTFLSTQAIETTQGTTYNWPMGIIINGSGYYLDYLPYLYPLPGSTVCQG